MIAFLEPFLPYIIAFFVGLGIGGGTAWEVQGARLDSVKAELQKITGQFDTFKAGVKATGEAQNKATAALDTLHEETLKKVKEDHEALLPTIRADAVANYLARSVRVTARASASGSKLPGSGTGLRVDDGTRKECLPDEAFIQDAAEDAAKLGAFQQYCHLNACPVKD